MFSARRGLLGLSACLLLLASCSSTSTSESDATDAGEVYQIGMATAQTGAIAPFDIPAVEGFKLGIDELNAAGGLDGKYPVELQQCDGRSDAAQSAVCAQGSRRVAVCAGPLAGPDPDR